MVTGQNVDLDLLKVGAFEMIKYTLCFIRYSDKLLMLNRQNHPNKGLWNGVGGKIEGDENPVDSVIREIYEETGIILRKVIFSGIVTWESADENSGMYVFVADWQDGYTYQTPKASEEGILDWKDIDWVLDSKNLGVVSNIPIFLAKMLAKTNCYQYNFIYKNNQMTDYTITEMARI